MVLFSKAVFKIHEASWQCGPLRNEIPFVDHISNIVMSLNIFELLKVSSRSSSLSDNGKEKIPNFGVDAISYFGETSRKRNTCIIEFRDCREWLGGRYFPRLLSSAMHALAGLTGFKTVQLSFLTRVCNWVEGTCPEVDPWVLDLSSALESTLGSFTITHEIRAYGAQWFWDYHVIFHPSIHPPMRGNDSDNHNDKNPPCLEPPS